MAKYKIGDVLRVHYETSFEADLYVVRAILSAGSFSPEIGRDIYADGYIWEEEDGTFSWDLQYDIDNEIGLTCVLVKSNTVVENSVVSLGAYPHICDYCGSPCWNGMNFNCSNPNCITKG